MCLIVVKPAGVKAPTHKQMKYWFGMNPNGFGMMFQRDNKVEVFKGAMTIDEMFKLIKSAKIDDTIPVVYHFRFATHGVIAPKTCHPFDFWNPFKEETHFTTKVAVMHNGVISACPRRDITDTQWYIENKMQRFGISLYSQEVQEKIADETASRFTIMTPRRIILIGGFIYDKASGMYFSNSYYKEAPVYKWTPLSGASDADATLADFYGWEDENDRKFYASLDEKLEAKEKKHAFNAKKYAQGRMPV